MKRTIFLLPFLFLVALQINCSPPLYFCTAANKAYFQRLLNLIGCLHKVNFEDIAEIAVFNLGLEKNQIDTLKRIQKVKVYEIEQRHPDILKPFHVYGNKWVPGWYAWKPVAIKQALERFPYVLWLDAGTIILKPLNNAFKHIIEHGYMLLHGGPHPLHRHTTKQAINLFNLDDPTRKWVLDAPSIAAFWIGVTKEMGHKLIYPIYELTTDLNNFADDGSSSLGFGAARYEQALISIKAHLMGLTIFHTNQTPTRIVLDVDGAQIPFYATWEPSKFNANRPLYDVLYQVTIPMGYDKYIKY